MLSVRVSVIALVLLASEVASNATQILPPSCTVLQGPPGKDGRDGLPGRDGRDGLCGPYALSKDEIDKMKEQIKQEIANSLEPKLVKECTKLGRHHTQPASSCKEIYSCNQNAPSGLYWIKAHHNNGIDYRKVFCDMESMYAGIRGWTRVAYFNMTNSSHSCPHPLRQVTAGGKRLCIRSVNSPFSSVSFDNFGISYTRVCGRAVAYQYGNPNAFYATGVHGYSIDGAYMDGLSITHGSPRKHIWTLAVGRARINDDAQLACPCSSKDAYKPPSFVGSDYHCDSGNEGTPTTLKYYMTTPLWNGQGCPSSTSCCANSGMPWFCKTLPRPTSDKIEVRWCSNQDLGNEATPTELLELNIN